MKLCSFFLLLFCFLPVFLFFQNNLNPTFHTFKVTAYEIPNKEGFGLKYHPKSEKYPVITTFELNEINIPKTDDSNLFQISIRNAN
jgi:hypothetical protein